MNKHITYNDGYEAGSSAAIQNLNEAPHTQKRRGLPVSVSHSDYERGFSHGYYNTLVHLENASQNYSMPVYSKTIDRE